MSAQRNDALSSPGKYGSRQDSVEQLESWRRLKGVSEARPPTPHRPAFRRPLLARMVSAQAEPVAGPSQPRATVAKQQQVRERKAQRETTRHEAKKVKERHVAERRQEAREQAEDARVKQWPYFALSAARASQCPVLYNADGSLCFVPDTSSVRVYRSATAQLVSTLTPEGVLPDAQITSLLLNPSNPLQLYVATSDGSLRVWDYMEGREMRTLQLGGAACYLCSPPEKLSTVFYAVRAKSITGKGAPFSPFRRQNSRSFRTGKGKAFDKVFCAAMQKGGTALKSSAKLVGKVQQISGLALTHDGTFLVASSRAGGLHIASTGHSDAGFAALEATRQFTALATHPSELSFATGDSVGRIQIWYPFDQVFWSDFTAADAETRSRTIPSAPSQTFHWHAHAVASLAYTPNGAYLASGGEESVLVLWQLASGHREYVPRLGAPICHISLATGGQEYAVSLADASVLFVDGQSLTPRRSIAGIKIDATDAKPPIHLPRPLAVQPDTQHLVFASSHPSSIQFFSPLTASHILELEVSPVSRFSKTDDVPIEPARVEHVAFSPVAADGSRWMATLDSWKAKHYSEEAYLKLWRYQPPTEQVSEPKWALDTRIDRPHGAHKVTSLAFSGTQLATCGNDGQVRIWHLAGKAASWRCRSAYAHRDMSPNALAWSADGSALAVAYRQAVVVLDVSSESIRVISSYACSAIAPLSHVAFAGLSGALLIAAGENGVAGWDIVDGEQRIQLACRTTQLLARPGLAKVVALETFAGSDERPASTNAFVVDTNTFVVEARALSTAVKQAVLVDSLDPQKVALAVITHEGGLGLAGDGVRPAHSVPAMPIDAAAGLSARTLFDDLFGRPSRSTEAASYIAPSGIREKTALPEVLQAPSHVLPPLTSMWRELLLLPPKKGVEEPAEQDRDEMEVDDPASNAQRNAGPTKLPVYEHDLGQLLSSLKM